MTTKGTEAGHTPLPWSKYKEFIFALNGEYVAGCSGPSARSVLEDVANATLIVQSVNERAGLVAENKRLREALEEIERMKGMTLLGPDSRHHMGDDAPRYHEMGSAAAFEQAGTIAECALRSVQEGAPKA